MRTTTPRFFTSVTAVDVAALLALLLLLGATVPRPSSAASGQSGFTSDDFKETCNYTKRYTTIDVNNTVPVATTATPALMVNVSYDYVLFRVLHDRAVGSVGDCFLPPDVQTSSVGKPTRNPDGSTTATTTIASGATITDTTATQTSSATSYHDSCSGGGREDTDNKSRWRRFRHEPLRLPDQFMARFLNTLMYLAEVITADVISAVLFERWRPRYYQRAKKTRLNCRRCMRFRRFRMNATGVAMRIWDACIQLHETLCLGQNDVSGPTYQMISNTQLTEYPATLSTFADVPTSGVIATVASARCPALVPIASTSASTSAFLDLSVRVSRGPPVSPLHLLLLETPEMLAVASCHPRSSLPDTGLEITLQPAVSLRSQFLSAAAPPPTGPALAPSQCLSEAAHGKMTLRVEMSPKSMCPSAIAATNACAKGTASTLVRYNTMEQSVTTPVEEFDGDQADTIDEPPPSPFFVSEHYTPGSTCFVSAHGVAYTTIIMSYTHQFNHPTRGDTQEETPATTQAGDVSDILWPAANARMRCKWSQVRIQTLSSEYYRSSLEAVLASCLSPMRLIWRC